MKIRVDLQVKDRLETFLRFVDKRGSDPVHVNNGDVIADFITKFVVVELKRLENSPEVFTQDIEIPDNVLAEPLNKMKGAFDKTFNDFMNGKGIVPNAPPANQEAGENVSQTATAPSFVAGTKTTRNGNGHATEMVRKLNDGDRAIIDAEFQKVNGEFEDAKKSATAILQLLPSELVIWQVTGRISHLHREIARGRLEVADMPSYMAFVEAHKELWKQYNSTKYQQARTKNTTSTPTPVPNMKKGKFKQATAP